MEQLTVAVEVPADVYRQVEEVAVESDRTAESVIVDVLTMMFRSPSDSILDADDLKCMDDDMLLAIWHSRLAWSLETRLRELMHLGQLGKATNEEVAELEDLVAQADNQVILRSEALILLKQRGHNIDKLLNHGAN